jgi:hypothetical protein
MNDAKRCILNRHDCASFGQPRGGGGNIGFASASRGDDCGGGEYAVEKPQRNSNHKPRIVV